MFIDQPTHHLPMFQHERRLVAAHLQHAARPGTARRRMAETGVKKACVMHPKLTHHRQIGRHFGGIVGGNCHRLAADQNIKGAGVKDDAPLGRVDFLPEFRRRVMPDLVQIDHPGMRFGTVTDQIALIGAQVDREAEPFGNNGFATYQRVLFVQRGQGHVIQHGMTLAKPDLVQPLPGADQDAEAARADLCIQGPVIAFGNAVKLGAAIGDQTGQQIQTPG